MDGPLFEVLVEWTSTVYDSLHQLGWTVTLDEFESGEQIVLELENSVFLGRFTLQDTGQVELGVRDKRTSSPLRGKCEVYTTEQLYDAIGQFLEWVEQDHSNIQETEPVACPQNKISYTSRQQALWNLQRIIARRGDNAGQEEYQCALCHQWHIGTKKGKLYIKRRSFPQHGPRRRKRK